MPAASTPDTWPSPGLARSERLLLAAAFLASLVLAVVIVARLAPPEVVPASAAPQLFSAERARVHLERVARVPHPVGSDAAREVEGYITSTLHTLGLRVESMVAPACTEAAGLRRCGNVRNVVGTLPGRTHEPALLLSAHYDSVPNAPGAGDDGAAVAALLEAARALAASGEPERDVVFAFLDGEEELMLGAAAFCHAASGQGRIGVVANFDARGNRGAATLVGTSPGSSALLGELLGGLTHPIVNSFYPSVASVLPNATDAEIYERCGFEALSFAFADGFESYHQGTDSPERLDERSLQHHGSYALDLARPFASTGSTLAPPQHGGLVFFDVAGVLVIRYSALLARALGAALVGAALVALGRRVRAGELTWAALGGALGWSIAGVALATLCGAASVPLLTAGFRQWLDYVHAPELAGCAAGLVLGLLIMLVGLAVRRGRGEVPRLGPLLVWLLLAGLCAAFAPGLSHLFTWPAAALLVAALLPARAALARASARALASLLGVLLLTPVAYALIVVVGAPGVAGGMACLALFFGIWAQPLAALVPRPQRLAALALALALAGAVVVRVDATATPGPAVGNAVAYALDSEARRARWVSADAEMDDWKRQLLGDTPERVRVPAFLSEGPLYVQDAPLAPLEPPRLELVSDAWGSDGRRTLSLRARSPRGARNLRVWEANGVQFTSLRFDGAEPIALVRFSPELDRRLFRLLSGMDDGGLWSVSMFAPGPDGALLTLSTTHAGALELRCTDRSEGLVLQPSGMSARAPLWTEGYPGDHTLVSAAPLRVAALTRP
jgi:peptidase M28-like protein